MSTGSSATAPHRQGHCCCKPAGKGSNPDPARNEKSHAHAEIADDPYCATGHDGEQQQRKQDKLQILAFLPGQADMQEAPQLHHELRQCADAEDAGVTEPQADVAATSSR